MEAPVERGPCVLVCHTDAVLRLGMAIALERSGLGMRVIECGQVDDFLDEYLNNAIVVVSDFEQGLDICRRLGADRDSKAPHVLVVTSRGGEHDIRSAIAAGAKGYLLVGFSLYEFVNAVRELSLGARYLSNAAALRIMNSLYREPLTDRETQVYQHLIDGCANKRIAQLLGISVGTVKSHVRSLFGKLGVSSRTQAVCEAAKLGPLAKPDPHSRSGGYRGVAGQKTARRIVAR